MKYKILIILFTISLAFSILLSVIPTDKLCGEETSSCSIVQNSQYKETLGIKNSIMGIISFSILIFLTLSHMRNPKKHKKISLALILLISTIIALHFIYLQMFIIKAFCPYCMIIDISTILALTVILKK